MPNLTGGYGDPPYAQLAPPGAGGHVGTVTVPSSILFVGAGFKSHPYTEDKERAIRKKDSIIGGLFVKMDISPCNESYIKLIKISQNP